MKLSQIIEKLNLQKKTSFINDTDIKDAYVSDLLSDVMGNGKEGQMWLTMQTHKNVAAIASLKDMAAVIIVANGKPEEEMLNFATDEGVCILVSSEPCFEIAGKLYELIK